MIHKAIEFATKAHKNQVRKGTDTPYIVHPFEVAIILTENGCDEKVIIAGLLHDTIEDTDVTIEDIEHDFGSEIAELVSLCSEDKTQAWGVRKQHTIDFLKDEADFDMLILSCADKLSNLRSMKEDYNTAGEKLWERFNRPKEKQNWYYKSLIDCFEPLSDYDMYLGFLNTYRELFGNSKTKYFEF